MGETLVARQRVADPPDVLAGAERGEAVGGAAAVGQRQLGIELEQRHEHEPARQDLRVGQRQPQRGVLDRAEQQQVDVDPRGPWRTSPGSRPWARSTSLQASSSCSGSSSVSIRMQALKKSRWSSTRPTGSVSYTDDEASTSTPRCGSAATALDELGAAVADVGPEAEVADLRGRHSASRQTSTDTSLTTR